MAFHYKAPLYLTIDLERFFEDFNPVDKLKYNIGDTGWSGANYRGLVNGKDKSLNEDFDYKILILEEFKCLNKEQIASMPRNSESRPNFTLKVNKTKNSTID